MLIEEKYPHLKNPTKAEWHIVAVRSAILVLACVLITATAYIFGSKRRHKPHNAAPPSTQSAASTRGGIFYSPAIPQSNRNSQDR